MDNVLDLARANNSPFTAKDPTVMSILQKIAAAMLTTGDRTWRMPRLRHSRAMASAVRRMRFTSNAAAKPMDWGKAVASARINP